MLEGNKRGDGLGSGADTRLMQDLLGWLGKET